MKVYLIKENKIQNSFENVIEWNKEYCIYKAGQGTCKIYASEGEYFTDVEPVEQQ
jgi:hypothetical protein